MSLVSPPGAPLRNCLPLPLVGRGALPLVLSIVEVWMRESEMDEVAKRLRVEEGMLR